jgi:hypothetical protein
MARRLFIHIGPPKTGTTFLQAAWFQHRDELATAGVLYPGEHRLDQFRACAIAVQKTQATQVMAPRYRGTWTRLTDDVREWEGDAILSSEHYAVAGQRAVTGVVEELQTICDELHVVVTARDLARQVPAAWQQSVKHGKDEPFDAFWRRLADEPGSGFWIGQDLPALLARWSTGLPESRVHLVVHGRPGSPRDLFWTRMCQVTGVDPGILGTVARTNESIGAVNAELVRRVNSCRPEGVERLDMARLTKSSSLAELLGQAGPPVPISLPPDAQEWARARGLAMVDVLRSKGYDVVGDLDELVPDPEPAPGRTPDSVTDAELAATAAPVIAALLAREVERRQKRRRRAAVPPGRRPARLALGRVRSALARLRR